MTGEEPQRRGNRHASIAPHGVYASAGENSWVAVSVDSDEAFEALCRVIGRPELSRDERFADVVSRHCRQDELDEVVSAWTQERSHREAANALQAAGIAAAPVLRLPELPDDPHLTERAFFEEVTHREAGTWPLDGPAWRFDLTPAHTRLPAPCFAEHNDYVLQGLLGLSEEDVAELERKGVVAREPAPGQDE
jgi:crotonobetainyl-CoA:carnitine CoA-transferase CaiB-like acyl-CoA transferase